MWPQRSTLQLAASWPTRSTSSRRTCTQYPSSRRDCCLPRCRWVVEVGATAVAVMVMVAVMAVVAQPRMYTWMTEMLVRQTGDVRRRRTRVPVHTVALLPCTASRARDGGAAAFVCADGALHPLCAVPERRWYIRPTASISFSSFVCAIASQVVDACCLRHRPQMHSGVDRAPEGKFVPAILATRVITRIRVRLLRADLFAIPKENFTLRTFLV